MAEGLTLTLRRDGKMLRVLWDRAAPVLREARQAELYITDGNHQSKLRLSNSAIRSGMLSYWPETENVAFRLEVFAGDRTISASAQSGEAIAPAPAPAVAAKAELPTRATTRPPKLTRIEKKKVPRVTTASAASADRSAEQSTESPWDRPSPFAPPPPLAPGKAPLPAPEIPSPPTHRATPSTGVSMVAEPSPPSRLRRAAGRVPFVRRLRKLSEPVQPPKPVHQVMPVISAADRRSLVLPLSMNVLVEVDRSGKVASVEPLASTGDWGSPFAVAAVSAARNWKFAPARMGEESVPAKVVLHFRFEPLSQ